MSDAANPVSLTILDRIAVIVIDNPPVNATSQSVRAGLLTALETMQASPEIDAAVIACAGKTFVAGGDIREFGKPPLPPSLPEVCGAIENANKPIVAAVHGTALGGGLEIAIACHGRVLAGTARVGLPEVKLGLVPGSGGTQRLPRLVGLEHALDLVTSGRQVAASEALEWGLADEVASGDVREAAISLARSLVGTEPRRTGGLPVQPLPAERLASLREAVVRKARGQQSPVAGFDITAASADLAFDEGLRRERALFYELMAGAQSRALRHAFFAEREVFRVPGLENVAPRSVERAGVVGAGTMGAGISVALADAGIPMTVVERDAQALAAGKERVQALYSRQVKSGRLSASDADARLARMTFASDYGALAECDLVIEAVFEDMGVKKDLVRALGPVMKQGALLATNTSYLDVGEIADASGRPQDVVGLHFFAPANIMKLLEIVRAPASAPDAVATGVALAKRLGKIPVVCGVCDGFVGNRILAAYRQEAEFLLDEGALPQDVDAAMEAFGFAMGPFAVSDLSGLDIAWARRKRLAPTRDPRQRYSSTVADRLCEMGRLGQKTGAGWYRYVDGRRTPDPVVAEIIEEVSRAQGITRDPVPAASIQERLRAVMINEGRRILEEGIVSRPLDIDLVMIHGFGYPAWRGGPMFEASEMGR